VSDHPAHTVALPWWRDRLLLGVTAVFSAWALLALTWPLSGDAGVFSWMADTVMRGGAPYSDAWDTKGPAAWVPSLLMQALVGRTTWGIRVFDIAMVIAAVCALRSIARQLEQPGDGRVAVALYGLWYASLDFWQSAQPDGWVAAWLIVACRCAMSLTTGGALAAGALVGVSTMSKPFYLGYVVVMLMIVAYRHESTRQRPVWLSLMVLAGVGLGLGAMLLVLSASGGTAGYFELLRWNAAVYAQFGDPWLTRIPAMLKGMLLMPWGIVAPLALFGAIRPTRMHRRTIMALAVGFVGAVAGVLLQGKGWQYHWLPMLPFLALLADIGFASLRSETAGEIAGRFRVLALVLCLAVACLTPAQQLFRYSRARANAEATAEYERREFRFYGRHVESAAHLVDSLAAIRPQPGEVLVWAMHLGPQYTNNLRVPTKFAVLRPLYDGAGTAYRAAYRAQFERELRDQPPHWWLIPMPSLLAREADLQQRNVVDYPAAAAFLRDHYRAVHQTTEWRIYERVAPSATR
jgi:hypothetical protein